MKKRGFHEGIAWSNASFDFAWESGAFEAAVTRRVSMSSLVSHQVSSSKRSKSLVQYFYVGSMGEARVKVEEVT